MSFKGAQARWDAMTDDRDDDALAEQTDEVLLGIINDEPDWEEMSSSRARKISARWEENAQKAKEILHSRSYFR